MTVSVSERLRDALERLDLAIDQLEGGVPAGKDACAPDGVAKTSETTAIAARLDKMIARIETALAD